MREAETRLASLPSLPSLSFIHTDTVSPPRPPPQVPSQPLGLHLPDPGDCGEHLCFKMPLSSLLLSRVPRETPLHLNLPARVSGRGRRLGVYLGHLLSATMSLPPLLRSPFQAAGTSLEPFHILALPLFGLLCPPDMLAVTRPTHLCFLDSH